MKVFTIYGHGGHLGHVTCTIYINFIPPSRGGSTQNLALIGQAVSKEKIFEIVDRRRRRTDNGRTLEHRCTISSPCEPDGSGELIRLILFVTFAVTVAGTCNR